MYTIKILDTINNTSIQLNYENPTVRYSKENHWFSISVPNGQQVHLSNIPVLIFDNEINNDIMIPEFTSMWMNTINENYKNGYKTLLIFSSDGIPLHIFSGEHISIIKQEENATHFTVDDKDVCIQDLGFMVLTR